MENLLVKKYIKETKSFFEVQNFKQEILDFQFGDFEEENQGIIFHLGHPQESHKGRGLGDILAYSQLPQLIKERRPDAFITLPKFFKPFYKFNPHISAFQNKFMKWGSLGTHGTTFQRACNVWNISSLNPFPSITLSNAEKIMAKMYKEVKIPLVIVSTSSVSGQEISKKNLKVIVESIEDFYEGQVRIEQVGLSGDPVLGRVASYHFDVPNYRVLVNIIAKADWYIGPHNGLSHIAKAVGVKSIIILTANIPTDIVYLPYLTQTNILETNMLSENDLQRKHRFMEKCKGNGMDLSLSGELGWLYPDNQHLTDSQGGTERIPTLDYDNLFLALVEDLYPYREEKLWNIEKHSDLWCEGDDEIREMDVPEISKEVIEVQEMYNKLNESIQSYAKVKDNSIPIIGVQILSFNKPDLLVQTIDSLIMRQQEDKSYKYVVNILEQSDKMVEKEKILKIFLGEGNKYTDCGMTLKLWNSPKNLGQRGGSNFLFEEGCWDEVDYVCFSDHDNLFHEPLSIYCDVLNKYHDCYIVTGYNSPEHSMKRIIIDNNIGTIVVKSTQRFGHHFMRIKDVDEVFPVDEKHDCGGAAWYCGMDFFLSHWSPVAPGRTSRNETGFIYCISGAVQHIGIDQSTWLGSEWVHPEYTQHENKWIRSQTNLETILKTFPNEGCQF